MKGYPEYYTIVYRDDQRVMILEDNPKKRVIKRKAPPKRGSLGVNYLSIGRYRVNP